MAMNPTAPGIPMPEPDYSNRAIGVAGLGLGQGSGVCGTTTVSTGGYDAARVRAIKDMGTAFLTMLGSYQHTREGSLAKTKIEEAVMWAVKGITG